MRTRATDSVIEEIIFNADGGQPDARKRHVFRQILYSLVRLARAEQLQDMRHDVALARGGAAGSSRHQARVVLRKIGMDADQSARPSAFGAQHGPQQESQPDGASLPCPGPGCPDDAGGRLDQ